MKIMKRILFCVAALAVSIIPVFGGEDPDNDRCDPNLAAYGGYGYLVENTSKAAVWWAEGAYKVLKDTPLPSSRSKGIRVSSARNESESFIVVVNPKSDLGDVKVDIAPWKGGAGEPFGEKIRKVEYVNVTMPTDYRGWRGEWPDPLPLYESPQTLGAGENHSFWITIKTPEGKPAGTYTSTLTLSDSNGWRVEIPISLKVWDFTLPKTPSVRSSFGLWGHIYTYDNLTTPEQKEEGFNNYMKSFAEHRISPTYPMERHPVKHTVHGVNWERGNFDSSTKVEGKYSYVVSDNSYSAGVEAVYKPGLVPVTAGRKYTLSFFARSDKENIANVIVEFYDKDGKLLPFRNSFLEFKALPTWEKHTLDVDAYDDSAAYVKIRLLAANNIGLGEAVGKTWYDDVRLVDDTTGENIFPDGNFEVNLDDIGVTLDFTDFSAAAKYYFDELGFNAFHISLMGLGGGNFHSRNYGSFAGFPSGSPEYEKLMGQYLVQMEEGLRECGMLDKGYVYWFDEPGSKEDYDFVRRTHEMMRRLAPGIHTFITEHKKEFDISDVTDISCSVWPVDLEKVAMVNSREGNEFWSYLCTGPKSPYINLFIDSDAINMRLWLWASYMYRLKGILIWTSSYWNSPEASPSGVLQDPWTEPMSFTTSYGTANGDQRRWGNGDGRLFYPLNRHPNEDRETVYLGEPVPSLRLEILRDGVDDYDYLTLLEEAIAKAKNPRSPLVREARSLLTLPKDYYQDDRHFSKDPRFLIRRRERIAGLIEKLSR